MTMQAHGGRRPTSMRLAAAWLAASLGLSSVAGAAASMAAHAHRARAAGIDLVTYQTGVKDVVVIVGSLPAGDVLAGAGNIAIPTLTGMMLDRGTRELDKFEIARRLDDVGAKIAFSVGTQTLDIHAKCLRKDLKLVLGLIAAELRTPAFSAAEFAKARQQFEGTLESSLQNTTARAHEAFVRAVFPPSHPNRVPTAEDYLAAVRSAELDQVRSFHARIYGPKEMTLVLAGDVSDAEARREVERDFRGWSGGADYQRAAPASASATSTPDSSAAAGASTAAARVITIPLKDKPSATVMLGQATGLRYRDPDALALRVGTAVLGHGFTGRLMSTVRDREGLTYGIGAGMSEDSFADGDWFVSASFAPPLLARGVESTHRVIASWWADGVTEPELDAHKQGLIGNYRVSLATTGGIAAMILSSIQRGYDLDWLDRYPQAIAALTRTEVDRAIRAHLDPKAMVLVEAGSVAAAAP